MRRSLAIAAILTLGALVSGCVVETTPTTGSGPGGNGSGNGSGSGGTAGSVTFAWSFNGGEGCNVAGVDQVRATVAGQTVVFPCSAWANGGRQGTIDNVPAGTQDFTLTGVSFLYDGQGVFVKQSDTYQATGTVNVLAGADNQTPGIDLAVIAANVSTSSLVFLWDFGGTAATCSMANISQVTLAITDPANPFTTQAINCTGPDGTDGIKIEQFTAGTYPFSLSANDGTNDYFASGTAYVNGISDTVLNVDLQLDATSAPPANGPGSLQLDFTVGGGSCAAAGVDHILYYLTDGSGNVIGNSEQTVPCVDPLGSVTLAGLSAPATYFLYAEGLSNGTATYELLQYAVAVYPGTVSIYSPALPAVAGL